MRALPLPPLDNPLLVQPPPAIEGYQITGELGRGGMGVVYAGIQLETGMPVALKVLPSSSSEGLIRRFDQEIKIATMLDHPDIVKVFASGWGHEHAWIAMEVLDGFELWQAIQDRNFTLSDRISVLVRIAYALQYAHEHNIVHRDVKPSNVFLTRDGGVRLLDFGVAKMRDVRLTKTGKTVGTPQYMAPEQIMAQKVDARTDVFALAAVAYEVLAGVPPWHGEHDHQIMMAICTAPPRPFSDAVKGGKLIELPERIVGRLQAVLHKGLSAEPTRRHKDMTELAQALEACLRAASTEETEAVVAEQPESAQQWANRRIDWAQARAARLRVESLAPADDPDGTNPTAPVAAEPAPAAVAMAAEEEESDGSMVVWVVLCGVFAVGLGIAPYFVLG